MNERTIEIVNLKDNGGVKISLIEDYSPCIELRLCLFNGIARTDTPRFIRIGLPYWNSFKEAIKKADKTIEGRLNNGNSEIQI